MRSSTACVPISRAMARWCWNVVTDWRARRAAPNPRLLMFWLNCSAWVGKRSTNGGAQEPEDRHDRVGRDLEALEAHVDRAGGVADERRREATAELGCHEQGELGVEVLGQQPDAVTELVHRHADVLAEEVATVVDDAGVSVDQRVVRGRVHLDLDLTGDRREALDDRSDELRQATNGVAVLDRSASAVVVVAAVVRSGHPGTGQHRPDRPRRPPLSRVRLVAVDERVERFDGGRQRLDRQCVGSERHHQLDPSVVDAQGGHAGHG